MCYMHVTCVPDVIYSNAPSTPTKTRRIENQLEFCGLTGDGAALAQASCMLAAAGRLQTPAVFRKLPCRHPPLLV